MPEPTSIASTSQAVLGQKYAFATASLLTGLSSYIHLLGLEKAALAVVFAWMALRTSPPPRLREHRAWAQLGLGLGVIMLVMVPMVVFLFRDRLAALLAALEQLQ